MKTAPFVTGSWPGLDISARQSAPPGARSDHRGVATAYAKCADTRAAISALAHDIADVAPAPLFVLLFLGGRHDPQSALDAMNATFPGIPFLGVSGTGVIASEGFGYSGFEAGVIAWAGDRTAPRLVVTTRLAQSDHAGGAELGRLAKSVEADSATVLLFYSSVRSFEPRELHSASKLIDGFYDGWDGEAPTLIGGGALTDLNLSESWLLTNDAVHRHAAAALVFPRVIQATTEILRACRPASAFMQITKLSGDRVLELDGRPALDEINSRLPAPLINAEGHPSQIMILGKKLGDRFGPASTADFVNRLILTGDPKTKSITLFEPDFSEGDWVQLMSHDADLMVDEARNGARACRTNLPAFRPLVRLYIDCAGRARVMSATPVEEAGIVQGELLNDPTPLMGFYSGVEIAPVDYRSRSLDWTGVLTTLVETV